MRIIFVRHGEPDYETDSLTEKGRREVAYLGERAKNWKVDDLYVSPLGRARQTAEPIEKALGRKAEVLDWLQEFRGKIDEKYGSFTGVPWDIKASVWTKDPVLYDQTHWYESDIMSPVQGLPSVKEIYLETIAQLDQLIATYGYEREDKIYRVKEHSDATVVLVCHMGITCIMLSHLLGIPFSTLMQGGFLAPSSVTVVNTEEREEGIGYFRFQCLGDTRHLALHGEPISRIGYFAELFQD